jgi:hypothetical protein
MSATMNPLLRTATLLVLALCMSCMAPPNPAGGANKANLGVATQLQALASGQPLASTLPFSVGMDLGVGLDAASQSVLSQAKCLETAGASGQIESHSYFNEIWKYQVARDKKELRDLIDISAKLSGTVGVIRIGIEARYYDEMVRDSNSVYILVQYDLLTRSYGFKAPTMTLDGFDGQSGRADNRNGSVLGTIRNYYGSNYDLFRKKCGDSYLNTVVTGGRYLAVLEIKTTNRFDKNILAGELEGTYLPYMITVRGALDLMLSDLQTNHEVRIHVLCRGDNRADSVVSLSDLQEPDHDQVAELMEDIQRFRESVIAMDQEASQTPYGYRRGAMYGVFASYEPTAHEVQQGGYPADQVEAMRSYARAFEAYEAVDHAAGDMLLRPELYGPASDIMVGLVQREARLSQKALELASQRCALSSGPICRPVEALGLRTPETLRQSLPSKAPPRARDCREFRELFGDHTDGDKLVYLGGRSDQSYFLYCAGMAEEEPENYLPLQSFDPPSQNPATNFSRSFGGVDGKGGVWRDALSIYSKLRVHVNEDSLVVVPGQAAFVTDASGALPSADEQVPWASAKSCKPGRQQAAVADLSGTPFVFADENQHRLEERAQWLMVSGMTWFQALDYAQQRGGTLLHVSDIAEQDDALSLLDKMRVGSTWLGLINSRSAPQTFTWADGQYAAYRNWAEGFPSVARGEQSCAWLGDDGFFREGSCRDTRPAIMELRRVRFDVSRDQPSLMRLFVDARSGCGTVEPNPELVLRYAP